MLVTYVDLRSKTRTLLSSAVWGVDPEPSTDASALGARGHLLGHLEIGEPSPNACLVDAKDREILRLHLCDIALVRNGERAAEKVLDAVRVPFAHRAAWTWVIPAAYVSAL